MCNERCQNALGYNDLCDDHEAEYEAYLVAKYEEELFLDELHEAQVAAEIERIEDEDSAEQWAMYLIEKGA